jgi:hypothetical protein
MGWYGLACLPQNWDQWKFWLHKILGNASVAAQLAAAQEGLSSTELVS